MNPFFSFTDEFGKRTTSSPLFFLTLLYESTVVSLDSILAIALSDFTAQNAVDTKVCLFIRILAVCLLNNKLNK